MKDFLIKKIAYDNKLLLSIPLIAASANYFSYVAYQFQDVPEEQWILNILGVVIFAIGGMVITHVAKTKFGGKNIIFNLNYVFGLMLFSAPIGLIFYNNLIKLNISANWSTILMYILNILLILVTYKFMRVEKQK